MPRQGAGMAAWPSWLVGGAVAILLAIVLAGHAVTQYIDQDEEQYVAAAYIAQEAVLYRDFLYLQPPVYPLVLSELFALSAGTSRFLVARLLSAGLAIGAVGAFFLIARSVSGRIAAAAICTALFASSPVMLRAFGSTRNDVMPVFFGLCGTALLLAGQRRDRARRWVALLASGICLALAVATKLSAAFLIPAALLYLALRERRSHPLRSLVPVAIGMAIGGLPILAYAARDWERFRYSILTFHVTAPAQYYSGAEEAEYFTLRTAVWEMADAVLHQPALIGGFLFLLLVLALAPYPGGYGSVAAELRARDGLLALVLAAMAIPFVVMPRPFGLPYAVPLVPYLLLSCAAAYPVASQFLSRNQLGLVAVAAGAIVAIEVGRLATEVPRALDPARWTVTQVNEVATLVTDAVAQRGGGPVATLYPLLVLDAGGTIYRQFATGIYFFRSSARMADERVLQLHGASPGTLATIFASVPPAAILVGDTAVEKPLQDWAVRNCYTEAADALSSWRGGPYNIRAEDTWRPRLLLRPSRQACDG
jgi:4-amino-4-deoxy-L-arabinose transferase-like glycosyltransferase